MGERSPGAVLRRPPLAHRRGSGRLHAVVLAALGALPLVFCKDKPAEGPKDAGFEPRTLADVDLAFQVELPPAWRVEEKPGDGRFAEARRLPERDREYLVAPRFAISVEPARATELDQIVRQTMNDLRSIEERGARVNRSTLANRIVDGVTVGDIELAYELQLGKGAPREVVQRSLVALRTLPAGSQVVWTLTVTHMSEDAELIAPEVQEMLATLRFVPPTAGGGDAGK